MGIISALFLPVLIFLFFGNAVGADQLSTAAAQQTAFNVFIFAALFISLSAGISLVTIISIYREAGILKRLRATPLSPVTILGAHVFIKIVLSVVSLAVLVVAGRQMFPGALDVGLVSFTAALLLGTLSILSLAFVIASVVPTARFAQPITAAIFYPMIALSGIFFPIDRLPRSLELLAFGLPTTHAVILMQGVWDGSGWSLASTGSLLLIGASCTGFASWMFRWE